MKRALTHLKLELANQGKLDKLDQTAKAYMELTQAYVDWLIANQVKKPNKHADLPSQLQTQLSARWQRCAWRQACGIVQSWYSNNRTNPPVLRNISIQANANVVVIEPSNLPIFDYWLRISTLEAGEPIRVPIRLYDRAKEAIKAFEKLCKSVTLNKQNGRWYATFVVEKKKPAEQKQTKKVIGIDIGMVDIVATSQGNRYGQISQQLRKKVEKSDQKRRRKQKLNAILKRKNKPTVSLVDHKAQSFARNQIGQALNQMIQTLPIGATVAIEDLSVADMRFKSRQMNRVLKASQLGYIKEKLEQKFTEQSIVYKAVQPAYSSQQCSKCGFTLDWNRKTQAEFRCLWCHYKENADINASLNIAERFSDEEINSIDFRQVKAVLAKRFMGSLPHLHGMVQAVTRSVSVGLDTLISTFFELRAPQSG